MTLASATDTFRGVARGSMLARVGPVSVRRLWWFPLLGLAYAAAIVFVPLPQNLAALFALPLLVMVWRHMRLGVLLWIVASALGNMLRVDLPGVPPLRATHMLLLLLLAVWVVKHHRTIPDAVSDFLLPAKNRVLVLLLAWIALSMWVARVTGVTREGWKYQFNVWFSVALAVALAFLVSRLTDRRLVVAVVWVTVLLDVALTSSILATGWLGGVGLGGWKAHYYEFRTATGVVPVTALWVALLFVRDQKWWGQIAFGLAAALSVLLHALMVLGGSRSDLLPAATLGFLVLIARPRLFAALAAPVVAWVILFGRPAVQSWAVDQTQWALTPDGVAIGDGARIALWRDALATVQRHPLWGTGSDLYRHHANVKVVGIGEYGGTVVLWSTDAHNTWLQAAVDHGAVAAGLVAVFFACVLKDALRVWHTVEDPVYRKYALFFCAQFCTLAVQSLFGQGVLPAFTASTAEEVVLAPYLVGFWLSYGIMLGIEAAAPSCQEAVGDGKSSA